MNPVIEAVFLIFSLFGKSVILLLLSLATNVVLSLIFYFTVYYVCLKVQYLRSCDFGITTGLRKIREYCTKRRIADNEQGMVLLNDLQRQVGSEAETASHAPVVE